MSYNYVLADSLARLANAQAAKLREVNLRFSKMFLECLFLLKKEGYILDFYVKEIKKGISEIFVLLKYYNKMGVISRLKLFSKPGSRRFIKSAAIFKYYNNLGVLFLSTSKGVLSGEKASKMNIGGELLFGVY